MLLTFGKRSTPPCGDCDRDGECTMNCGPRKAEAEVKRLRDVLAGIRDYDDPNLPASNKFQAIRNTAFRAIATQESRQ